MVIETMKKEHLSIYAAMQEFGISDHPRFYDTAKNAEVIRLSRI